ncbi:6928_t:CDS:2 [Diversispora eburnea]|uniref:6928_t:CDS:1 n=1 Tax=Diversispora eburnea TaxID=1213867 RepID=A0A9N9BRL9_9GLOM|nr:6928_t:CDS:2 [Diversispora eburnea]
MVSEIQFIDDDLANTSLDEDEYIVEKIISHRRKLNGEYQYFLKWKGYPDEESSWENESNIYSEEIIQEYWNKRGGRPNSSRRFFNQKSNNQIRHHNNSGNNNIRNDKGTNHQNSSKKHNNNVMEIEYINHDSSESLILENNKNYRCRRRGNFEEMEFEEENDDDNGNESSDEDYSRNYRKNYHRVKSVQRNNRIIRVRDDLHTPWGIGGLEEMDSWEEYIESVDYITREGGELLVYVTW